MASLAALAAFLLVAPALGLMVTVTLVLALLLRVGLVGSGVTTATGSAATETIGLSTTSTAGTIGSVLGFLATAGTAGSSFVLVIGAGDSVDSDER